ncbi:MAG: alpha/beta hydrolase [Microbacterium sp.]|jgi:pimeloyl-ACP methyl ester carboxylesterase|nr:alpha/beta hydrolase [Microbacterium sp.]
MDIILVPGLWLDASSWDPVLHALKTAGHQPFAMTMPGVGARASESAEIGMADWVDAVVARIDEADEPVILVGHSGGGNVVWGAADARPERVRRVVLVDTVPPYPGGSISEFPIVDGVVPFPGWEFFPDEDVYDLDAETRARTAPLTQSVPARVPTDPIALTRESRHGVPVTLLMGGLEQAEFEAQIGEWGPYGEEYGAIADAEVIKIGSGHWPQFSVPERLSELLVEAVSR